MDISGTSWPPQPDRDLISNAFCGIVPCETWPLDVFRCVPCVASARKHARRGGRPTSTGETPMGQMSDVADMRRSKDAEQERSHHAASIRGRYGRGRGGAGGDHYRWSP